MVKKLVFQLTALFAALLLPFVVKAAHHEGLAEGHALDNDQQMEALIVEEEADLIESTPLLTPADDNAAGSGVIDRYPADPSAIKSDSIARSAFARAIVDREPVDEIAVVTENRVYYFTELQGLEGQTVRHRWIYQGEVMADVEFMVGGPRWRVWSKKSLLPRWSGQWTVSVVDATGAVIQSETVQYSPR